MDTDTLITIVLVIGIVLLVLDIGLGSRLDDPLHLPAGLLLRVPPARSVALGTVGPSTAGLGTAQSRGL